MHVFSHDSCAAKGGGAHTHAREYVVTIYNDNLVKDIGMSVPKIKETSAV